MRCDAKDRNRLKQLCRYITPPALLAERVQRNVAGRVVLQPETPWRANTTRLVLSRLAFTQLPIK